METMTRAALYGRISTKDRGQEVENQMVQLREYAIKKGWSIEEFIDKDSGSHANRKGFKQLFEAAEAKSIDIVLVWALDRFTRQGILETFRHISRLGQYGIKFQSFTEPQFSTNEQTGELMLAVAAWIAQQERKRISERTKAGLAIARAAGRIGGRKPKNKPVEQIVALRAYGMSLRAISWKLKMSVSTVHRVIRSHQLPPQLPPQP